MRDGEMTQMEMFDTQVTTTISEDGTAGIARLAVDMVAEADMSKACEEFVKADKQFCKINLSVHLHEHADTSKWWDALEARYQTEKRLWTLFTVGERCQNMGRLYLKFREALLHGRSLKADA